MVISVSTRDDSGHDLVKAWRSAGRDRTAETADANFCPGERIKVRDRDRIELHEPLAKGEILYVWYTTDVGSVVREILG
jgi:hypothetical protein